MKRKSRSKTETATKPVTPRAGKKTASQTRMPARRVASQPASAAAAQTSATEQRLTAPEPEARAEFSGREMDRMVAEAAYFRAMRRGFEPGFELDDWVAAEAEIRKNLERGF